MSKFYKDLKAGLEEIIAYKEGKLDLRTTIIEVPEPPAEYKAKDIKKIREKSHYSQGYFAKVLNVSVKTVRSWESGQRVPSHATLRLLEIVDKGIYRPEAIVKK
jgi:putative transcriptional regulator